ncbi:hypothetical protein [Nostoc sp. FACHB-280]|uniref:hypothetical protein n=1 Tax=Nostoc sp. FACHB-280 TaxID=2692839 RepID=UPI00168B10D7|nr:hypothetical protein [Nostoc sp. FACHB-280]MBD2497899.1 hypothetical protein [Nostoc sp. FACHB-280]
MPQITPAQQPPVRCALPHLKKIAAPDEQALIYQDNSAWRQAGEAGEARGAGEENSCPVSSPAPGNKIMGQIFHTFEKHGLELLDYSITIQQILK